MQDSLEDYLKISKNKKDDIPTKVSPQLLVTLQRKKECEARAMKIVEFLIEGKLRQEAFLECLKHINPSYYQDVVEERAITKLCGYCLCNKRIPDMPKKQFHISTKTNKVYDITDRKNYCSNICYKLSIHIKAQIETSPLWLRKPEDVPQFNLLPPSERGIPGEEIDQGVIKPVKDDNVFTSVSLFTEASLGEVIDDEIKNDKKILRKERNNGKLHNKMTAIAEGDEDDRQKQLTNETETNEKFIDGEEHVNLNFVETKENVIDSKKQVNLNVVETTESVNETKDEKQQLNSNSNVKKTIPTDILAEIQKHVNEWITLETFIFLHGENKVKAILNETTLGDYFDKLKVADLQAAQQIKYLNICKKLKLKEIADEKFDRCVNEGKLRPVPDFKQLKEESKAMDLKVRAFYSGGVHEQDDTNFPIKSENNDDENELVLPLVDTNSQKALRRKIYLESVNRTLKKLLPLFDLDDDRKILDDVQGLVRTFNLQSHNTIFKPLIWTVIGVLLLKILTIKNVNLKRDLDCKQNQDCIKVLLKPFKNNSDFFVGIFNVLNDVEAFVERYITKNDQ